MAGGAVWTEPSCHQSVAAEIPLPCVAVPHPATAMQIGLGPATLALRYRDLAVNQALRPGHCRVNQQRLAITVTVRAKFCKFRAPADAAQATQWPARFRR